MHKVSVLLDGGNTRALSKKAGLHYTPDYIEKIAHACVDGSEELFRVLYYDCAPYNGMAKSPVSGEMREFKGSDRWLHDLARKENFAVRLGILKFRGFKPRKIPLTPVALTDDDFAPDFEQKGVDMRIGLDIANYCSQRSVDRIILATSDTDCIPAMKHARISGLQVVLVRFPNSIIAPELVEHCDILRDVGWPPPPARHRATQSFDPG